MQTILTEEIDIIYKNLYIEIIYLSYMMVQVLTNGNAFHICTSGYLKIIIFNIHKYSRAHTLYTLIDVLPEFSGFISSGLLSIEYVCIWGNRNDFLFCFVFFFF